MAKIATPQQILDRHDKYFDSGMRFYTVRANAELARDLLQFNVEPTVGVSASNRKASKRRIGIYNAQVLEGEWSLNPQPIVLSYNKTRRQWELIDGQQRLKSIIAADAESPGVEVPLTICIGAPLEAKEVIDDLKARTNADRWQMGGFAHAAALSTAIRMHYVYDQMLNGVEPYRSLDIWQRTHVSPRTQQAVFAENSGLVQAVSIAREARAVIPVPVGAVVFHHIARTNDAFAAAQVIQTLATGSAVDADGTRRTVEADSPLWILREYLQRTSGDGRRSNYEVFAMVLKAYNWWLRYSDTGWLRAGKRFTPVWRKNSERFPVIVSLKEALKEQEDRALSRESAFEED